MKRSLRILFLLLALTGSFLSVLSQSGQAKPPVAKASSIEVLMIESSEIKLPAEFQISLYENLIAQLQKSGGFQHVYRQGDRNALSASDLVILHSTVQGFKQGSEMARQVTTVAGKTTINIHCLFSDKDGKTVLERDLKGQVMFFGGNLRATLDFAKKAAKLAHENFVVGSGT